MKKLSLTLSTLCLLTSFSLQAKTFCSMTFNSADEKKVFSKHLTPVGYEHVELVPANKDPAWFSKACASVKACDVLVVSGHFGGIFFGEQSSATISLAELTTARELGSCPSILDKPKAVYLMGCNTLSSKSPDHRSVNDYLRVLVGDGFPLRLAEEVAAARYLNFGQSMAESMTSIFKNTPMVVGFESTGPLGAQAAPKLELAFKNSTLQDKNSTGVSKTAILNAFKGTNLRVVKPENQGQDVLKSNAISKNSEVAYKAWQTILLPQNIIKHYDFIIKNKTNASLASVISMNPSVAKVVNEKMLGIYQSAQGLSEIQVKILSFVKHHNLINFYAYEDALVNISNTILSKDLDYISADQLCSILREHQDAGIFNKLGNSQKNKLITSIYGGYLMKCAGRPIAKTAVSKAYQCLKNGDNHDWGCLTDNPKNLDVDACALAKSRNSDPENADDMMWYCYSNMRDNNYLNRAGCLELTHHFSLLGNQIKMNWNCLNRVSK